MNPFVIDAFEFCRLKERREADVAVAELPRLASDLLNKTGSLHWALEGGNSKLEHAHLTLSVSGEVQLMCQRCLAPYSFKMHSKSILVLAKNDEEADEIDTLLDDETLDVIVGSRAMNVTDLIEDEALLAMPLSPKHDICPDPEVSDAFKNKKESPFSVLKNLQ